MGLMVWCFYFIYYFFGGELDYFLGSRFCVYYKEFHLNGHSSHLNCDGDTPTRELFHRKVHMFWLYVMQLWGATFLNGLIIRMNDYQ